MSACKISQLESSNIFLWDSVASSSFGQKPPNFTPQGVKSELEGDDILF